MMENRKAIVCTVLYAVVIIGLLTASIFIRNEEHGISLYQLIMCIIANTWLGNSIKRFYDWLMH